MVLFSGLFGSQAAAGLFHSEAQFKENIIHQATMTPQTLAQLYEYGVSEDSELKLEYFFYTNSKEKAASLHKVLIELGYAGEYEQSANDDSNYIITGWTIPINMSTDSVISWTNLMCRIGFEHDTEFDGWGTNPEQ